MTFDNSYYVNAEDLKTGDTITLGDDGYTAVYVVKGPPAVQDNRWSVQTDRGPISFDGDCAIRRKRTDYESFGRKRSEADGRCQFCNGFIQAGYGLERHFGGKVYVAHWTCAGEVMCRSSKYGQPFTEAVERSSWDLAQPNDLREAILRVAHKRYRDKREGAAALKSNEIDWFKLFAMVRGELESLVAEHKLTDIFSTEIPLFVPMPPWEG